MINCLFLMFAVGCSKPVSDPTQPTEADDVLFPDEMYRWRWSPLTPNFGYDPSAASEAQGIDLTFVNLDPAGFGTSEDAAAAVRALGWMVSHPVDDFETPIWSRIVVEPQIGPVSERLARYGWLPSPYRAQFAAPISLQSADGVIDFELPLSLTDSANNFDEGEAGNRQYVSFNCMLCHAGVYGNNVVVGAPNKNINMEPTLRLLDNLVMLRTIIDSDRETARSGSRLAFDSAMSTLGIPFPGDLDISDAELDIVRASALAFDNHLRPMLNPTANATVGASAISFAGPYMVACSLTPRGETLDTWDIDGDIPGPLFTQMLAEVVQRAEGALPVANSRPWWLARYAGSHFSWHATPHGPESSTGDLTAFTSAVPNYGNHHTPDFFARNERHHDIMTLMDEIVSPPFPMPIDWEIAAQGLVVYGEHCAQCHGQLTKTDDLTLSATSRLVLTYDELAARVPLAISGTDPEHSKLAADLEYCFDNLKSNAQAADAGIVAALPAPGDELFIGAPPLVGMWASAPYLHNASVPTLRQVLDSASRPAIWRLDPDPYAYDYDDVGIVVDTLGEAPTTERSDPLDWQVYDTHLAGNGMSNAGHTFGDLLSEQERTAVIELLKALGTHNVLPDPIHTPW